MTSFPSMLLGKAVKTGVQPGECRCRKCGSTTFVSDLGKDLTKEPCFWCKAKELYRPEQKKKKK